MEFFFYASLWVVSISKLNTEDFLTFARSHPVLDVRSPGEYEQAHIPEALSFPIFSNNERKIIGTAYKQESRERAIKLGLDYFGKNMVRFVEEAEQIMAARKSTSKEIGVHCWRGGMRSAAIAWLLDLYGFKVYLLTGGYKAYRQWVLQQFEKVYPLQVIGGYSGGDKTGILLELKKRKEPVIDLEGLASHKGSAFGALGMAEQPSQEHFENLLAKELFELTNRFHEQPIWIEGESQRLGNINIPFVFYKNMRSSTLLFLDIPFEKRLQHIAAQYGKFEKEKLINGILRIKKKLGGLETKTAINALLEEDVPACFAILLKYYDKLYLKSTHSTESESRKTSYVMSETTDAPINTEKILQHVGKRNF